MRTNRFFVVLLTLLALMAAQDGKRAALGRALLNRPPEELLREREFAPTARALRHAQRQAQALEMLGIRCLSVRDLPARLQRANPPPAALFVRGDVSLLWRQAIAVVGARDTSPETALWAAAVAREATPKWEPEGDLVSDARAFTPTLYGINSWADIYTPRQTVGLTTFSSGGGVMVSLSAVSFLNKKTLASNVTSSG